MKLMIVISLIFILACSPKSNKNEQINVTGDSEIDSLREEICQLKQLIVELSKENQRLNNRLSISETDFESSKMDAHNMTLATKIKASPIDYVEKEIRLQGLFSKLSTHNLDEVIGPEFKATDFLQFAFVAEDNYSNYFIMFHRCFMKKSKGEILYDLRTRDQITIYGMVISDFSNNPWIEIYKVEKGW